MKTHASDRYYFAESDTNVLVPEVILPVGKVKGWTEPAKSLVHELWWILFEAKVVLKNGPDVPSEEFHPRERLENLGFQGGLRW